MAREVIHVTEAFGGGVFHSVAAMVRQQCVRGDRVTVIATRRADTPPLEVIREELGEQAEYVEVVGHAKPVQLSNLVAATRARVLSGRAPVVHLHSSIAGAAIRVSSFLWFRRASLVYSPHGFGFLRLDLPRAVRGALWGVEKLLGRVGAGLILVSPSEQQLAESLVKRSRTAVVTNTVSFADLPRKPDGGEPPRKPIVVTAGRVVFQKAPWLFNMVASSLKETADFVWIGGGSESAVRKWLPAADNLEVTGWLSHAEVLERISSADVFLMTSLWEGMPVALIEAQACGIPAVVSDVVGNRDVVIDGVTGRVVQADRLASVLGDLLKDGETLQQYSLAALRSRDRFSEDQLGQNLEAAYKRLLA